MVKSMAWARDKGGAVIGVNGRGAEMIVRAIVRAGNVDLDVVAASSGQMSIKNNCS
ncbi:MAG: hypothetical protein ACK5IP_07745 [Paracoccus sp. (in: a-proteobacteria)]